MRGKLSQTRLSPTREGRRPLATGTCGLWVVLGFAVAMVGCADSGDANGGASTGDGDATPVTQADSSSAPFAWPADPSHPVLELVVEMPGANGAPDERGEILIELMPELAPSTVVAVAELASDAFYDGTTFHRVIPDFMVQGGDPNSRDRDPTNDGAGRNGRTLPDEYSDAPFVRGVVGMGNKGRANSASTQFFIMQADKRNLDGRYNAIGRVLHGMDVVDRIAGVDTDRTGRWGPKDRPIENVRIMSLRPVGQVAAIQQALDLEASVTAALSDGGAETAASGGRIEVARGARGSSGDSDDAPAAPAGEEWELLEAGGR